MNKILHLLRWSNMNKRLFLDVVQLLPLEKDKRIYILIEWGIGLRWHLLEQLIALYDFKMITQRFRKQFIEFNTVMRSKDVPQSIIYESYTKPYLEYDGAQIL